MRKLLVMILGSGALLMACSSTSEPQMSPVSPMAVSMDCDEAKDMVKSNHEKVRQAFINRDANTIGTLELQNRDIMRANMKCFPKMKQKMQRMEQMHKDMSM